MKRTSFARMHCSLARGLDLIGDWWSPLIVRDLYLGVVRFDDLVEDLGISRNLLTRRLNALSKSGIVERQAYQRRPRRYEYRLTEAGRELKPVIEAIGCWGQRWIDLEASLEKLDPNLLMWDMRRNIDPKPMPPSRTTVQVIFKDLAETRRNWWLVVDPDREVDLCSVDPGFDVDLYLSTDLRTMTEIWMGYIPIARAKEQGRLLITGNRQLEADLGTWMTLSPFARIEKKVA